MSGRPRKYDGEGVRFELHIKQSTLDKLKKIAHDQSKSLGKHVSVTDLINFTVNKTMSKYETMMEHQS